MKVKVLGLSAAEGKSKATGNPYKGYFLYYASQDERVIGMKAADTFVDAEKMELVLKQVGGAEKAVGAIFNLDFNDRGRLEDLALVKQQ